MRRGASITYFCSDLHFYCCEAFCIVHMYVHGCFYFGVKCPSMLYLVNFIVPELCKYQFSIFFLHSKNKSRILFNTYLSSTQRAITACARLVLDAGHRPPFYALCPFSCCSTLLQGTQQILHGIACTCPNTHSMSSNVNQCAHTLFCANGELVSFDVTSLTGWSPFDSLSGFLAVALTLCRTTKYCVMPVAHHYSHTTKILWHE